MERWPDGEATAAPETFTPRAKVGFRNWWGKYKRAELAESLEKPKAETKLSPAVKFGLPLIPIGVREDFSSWPQLVELLPVSYPGVKTSRDEAVVAFDKTTVEKRVESYVDEALPHHAMKRICPTLFDSAGGFKAEKVRECVQKRGKGAIRIVRYTYRPFDHRWLAWEAGCRLLDRPRPEFAAQVDGKNLFIEARQHQTQEGFSRGYVSRHLADNFGNGLSNFFPLYIRKATDAIGDKDHPDLFTTGVSTGPKPNLTGFAREYLTKLKSQPEDLFFHIVAVLHAPLYRSENAGALRQDWPRVPLPAEVETLRAGAALGREIAALLDPETPVPGVTDLKVRPELRGLGELATAKDEKTPDLALAARWGYAGLGGVVMPGPGMVRDGTRGEGFLDIHLNATTRWKDVPEPVWKYTLGGYQVLKKWLSYRESALLGRPLTSDEAQEFTHHVRRIAAILALHPQLDAHYSACASKSFFQLAS
jgi:hypothetical protein